MNYKNRRLAIDEISDHVMLRLASDIRQVKPTWRVNYKPGDTLFTLKQGSIVSEGMAWFMNQDAPLEFAKLLKEGFAHGFSHVVSIETRSQGMEATVGGTQYCNLLEYFEDPSYICVIREPDGLTVEDLRMMLSYEKSILGKDYDYGVFPWFAFMSMTGLQKYSRTLRKMTPIGHKDGAWVCSAFKADGYFHTKTFRKCGLFNEWNIYGIHVHTLFLDFPYKAFKIGEERKWLK